MAPNHLSVLGIVHTAISILAIIAGAVALFRYGRISPAYGTGRLYIWLTIITCVTGLPIMRFGHPTPGHFLAIIILAILPVGIYARSVKVFGKAAEYVQIFIMSLTLFFSMVPATVETLTRLPVSAPLAADPNAPVIKLFLGIWSIIFLGGVAYQFIKVKARKKIAAASGPSINLS